MPYMRNLIYLLLLTLPLPWLVLKASPKESTVEDSLKLADSSLDFPVSASIPPNEESGFMRSALVVIHFQPILQELEQRYPDWECVISTTTKTGYELARQKYSPRTIFYCPLDFSWAVKSALRRIQPDLFILIELELAQSTIPPLLSRCHY